MLSFFLFLYASEIWRYLLKTLNPFLAFFQSILNNAQTLISAARQTIHLLTSHPPHLRLLYRNSPQVLKNVLVLATWQPPRLQPLLRTWWLRRLHFYTDPASRYEQEIQAHQRYAVAEERRKRVLENVASGKEPLSPATLKLMTYGPDPFEALFGVLPSREDANSLIVLLVESWNALAVAGLTAGEVSRVIETAALEVSAVERSHEEEGRDSDSDSEISSTFDDTPFADKGVDLGSAFDCSPSSSRSSSPPAPKYASSRRPLRSYNSFHGYHASTPNPYLNALKAKYESERIRHQDDFEETYLTSRYRMRVGRKVRLERERERARGW